jgi:hypothetical protein
MNMESLFRFCSNGLDLGLFGYHLNPELKQGGKSLTKVCPVAPKNRPKKAEMDKKLKQLKSNDFPSRNGIEVEGF